MKNNSFTEFIRKYFFYIGIGFLTIILVIIFRQKELAKFVEEGKIGLASFYTQNLKPMIYTNEITNEDVFNFAMFNSLPINKKENKLLFISQNEEGKNSISLHNSEYKENTDNYKKFVEYLGLNSKEKKQIDSLLSYYKAKLYTSIWADDKKTIAVNQNIPLIHDLVYLDIKRFANKINSAKTQELYADRKDVLSPLEIKKVDESIFNNTKPQDFIIVDNDSAYTVKISAEIPKLTVMADNSEAKWREEFSKSKVWSNDNVVHNIEKSRDLMNQYAPSRYKNNLRVFVPNGPPPKEMEKEFSKLKDLSKLSQMFTFDANKKDGKRPPIDFKMNFDFSKVDSIVANTMDAVMMWIPKEEREKVRKEIDSALAQTKLLRKQNLPFSNEQLKNMKKNKSKRVNNSDTTGIK